MKVSKQQSEWVASLLVTVGTLLATGMTEVAAAEDKVAKATVNQARQVSESGIGHSFLITGGAMTAIFNEKSEVTWQVKGKSRDGTVLPNGNILITQNKKVVEYLKGSQKIVWEYKLGGNNKEVASAWRLASGNTIIVENGVEPRLLEVTKSLEVVVSFALQPETEKIHLQSRMARKLENGNYLVPHLLAFKVKEYTPEGKVVHEIKTDLPQLGGREAENWPFTAIRLANGDTMVNLTHGNKTAIFNAAGEVVWSCDNDDVDGRFADPCGGQLLANGNRVICSYGQRSAAKPRIFEVNANKEVVWEFFHPKANVHEIHVLTTNGEALNEYQK